MLPYKDRKEGNIREVMFVLQLALRMKSRTGDGEGGGSYGNWTNGGREDVGISQMWRGRGTPIRQKGKQRPREGP